MNTRRPVTDALQGFTKPVQVLGNPDACCKISPSQMSCGITGTGPGHMISPGVRVAVCIQKSTMTTCQKIHLPTDSFATARFWIDVSRKTCIGVMTEKMDMGNFRTINPRLSQKSVNQSATQVGITKREEAQDTAGHLVANRQTRDQSRYLMSGTGQQYSRAIQH